MHAPQKYSNTWQKHVTLTKAEIIFFLWERNGIFLFVIKLFITWTGTNWMIWNRSRAVVGTKLSIGRQLKRWSPYHETNETMLIRTYITLTFPLPCIPCNWRLRSSSALWFLISCSRNSRKRSAVLSLGATTTCGGLLPRPSNLFNISVHKQNHMYEKQYAGMYGKHIKLEKNYLDLAKLNCTSKWKTTILTFYFDTCNCKCYSVQIRKDLTLRFLKRDQLVLCQSIYFKAASILTLFKWLINRQAYV